MLMPAEQTTGEGYTQGKRIKTYILEVRKTTKGHKFTYQELTPA